jgi:CHAT domain-containing protein
LNNSNLAILSACETGIGKEFRGEGVFSIARGFASAGCPSIIMSLWKVNDMVSADIMSALYKNLKKGEKLNEALRNSKITYINQSDPLMSHPANWAAFVPLGQVNAIYDRKLNPFIIGIIFLIVIIPIIFLIHRKLQKKV